MQLRTYENRNPVITVCKGGMTQQHHKSEVNINTIVSKIRKGGLARMNMQPPMFGDFTQATDFQAALDAVQAAQNDFIKLPAELRAIFKNNPAALLEFLEDEKNKDEAIKLGLVKAPPKAPDVPEPKPEPKPQTTTTTE